MRSILVMLVFTAVLSAGIYSASAEELLFDIEAAGKHVDKGIALLKENKYDAAISELEEAVSINPDAEGYYYLGYAYYMKGRMKGGKNDPESREKAIESFNQAFDLNPNFSPGRYKPAEAAEAEKEATAPLASEATPTAPDATKAPAPLASEATPTTPDATEAPPPPASETTSITPDATEPAQ